MTVRQTIVCKDSNNNYTNMQDIADALRKMSPQEYSNHLANWETKFVGNFSFDIDSQKLTVIRNWANNEDYEMYKTSISDRDSIFSTFESAGWSINVEVEYI